MTKQDIEELFKYFNNSDIENIANMIKDESLSYRIKELLQKGDDSNELLSLLYEGFHDIVSNIKQENLYNELENIGLTDNNKDAFLMLIEKEKLTKEQVDKYMPYASFSNKAKLIASTSDVEYIKQYINSEELSIADKVKLIVSTNDIEYIKEQVTNPEFEYEVLELVRATGDKEFIKQYLSEKGNLLTEGQIIGLIDSIKDPNFTIECIKDKSLNLNNIAKKELIRKLNNPKLIKNLIINKELDMEIDEKKELIKATGDSEFIKECVKEELGFPDSVKVELIVSTGDVEYIKQCVSDESYAWSSYDKSVLISSTNDNDYIKQCISDKNKKLDNMHRIRVLQELGDVEYIKEMLQNNEFDWNIHEKQEIVKATENKEFIRQCILDKNLNFDKHAIMQLILSTKDIDFIRECVKDKNIELEEMHIRHIIVSTRDSDFIKECLEDDEFSFDIKSKKDLIVATADTQYIREYLKDNSKLDFSDDDKRDIIHSCSNIEFLRECLTDSEITISNNHKVELILGTYKEEFIKECIENKELGFESGNLIDLVSVVKDKEYIEKLIKENTLDMQGKDKVALVKCLSDNEYIKRCVEEKRLNLSEFEESALVTELQSKEKIKEYFKNSEQSKKKIKLPEGITIGVEIEADNFVLQKELFDGWSSKGDGSIQEGLEIVSPVLTGSEEDVENIYTACNMLRKLNCDANEKCGGHVHIGASYLSDKQAYNNLLEIWGNTEKILYTISNRPGEITRYRGISEFAIPISKKIETALEDGSINLDNEFELDSFVFQLQAMQKSRYSGINFLNASDKNKQTIEFRLANGTIDPDTWVENINLFGGIIAASEKVYQIEQKEESERTAEENAYLQTFEDLKNGDKEDREKLDLLLELTIDKEDREIYVERYNANSEILKTDIQAQEALEEKISANPVVLKDKKSKVLSSGIMATEDIVTTSSIDAQEKNISAIERDRQQIEQVVY